jgi:Na+/proline symporter
VPEWLPYVLGAYVLAQLAVAAFASRFVRTEADYLLAGRNLGTGIAAISLFATWFGAETVIGSSGAVAADGLSGGRADPFGYTICLLLMAVFLAGRMRAGNYVTFGDLFRERFGPLAEKLAVLIMVPTSLIWAAAQILAFASILTVVTGFALESALIFTVVILIAYSSLGGMLGDVLTDLVQGGIVIIGLAVLFVGVIGAAGGWEAAFGSVTPDQLRIVAPGESWLARIDGWMIPILGSLVAQEAISRVLATRSAAIARRACFVGAGLYLTIGMLPVVIGLVGSPLVGSFAEQDTFLPTLAVEVMPPVLYMIFLGALVSAILSTIDSALLAVTALVGHNVVVPMFPGIDERSKTRIERAMVVFAGIGCYFIAVGGDTIFGLVELSSSFGSGGILVCVVVGLHSRFGNRVAALATLATGMALTVAGQFVFEFEAPYLIAVAGSLGVYVLVGTAEAARPRGTTTR